MQNDYDEIDKPWRTCQHEVTDIYLDDGFTKGSGQYYRVHGQEVCVDCDKQRVMTCDIDITIKNIQGDWEDE